MNRYKSGGTSKATASTQCQKCLQRGHYSYECTTAQQERPYVSRPSRTQQLLKPGLKPRVASPPPKTAASSFPEANPLKQTKDDDRQSRGRSRSFSESVSTVSTGRSRSPSHSDPSKPTQRPRGGERRSRSPRAVPASRSRSRSPRREVRRSRGRTRSPDYINRFKQPVRRETENGRRSPSPYSKRLAMSRSDGASTTFTPG